MEIYNQILILEHEETNRKVCSKDGEKVKQLNFYLYWARRYTIFNFNKIPQYGFFGESSAQVFCKQKALEHQKG